MVVSPAGWDSCGKREGIYFNIVGFSVTGQTLIYLARFELSLAPLAYRSSAIGISFTADGLNMKSCGYFEQRRSKFQAKKFSITINFRISLQRLWNYLLIWLQMEFFIIELAAARRGYGGP
jgi:hypothetical protein